jgi:Aromatic-ring-opening dioxygenase LigAB, LigA subunit
MAGRAMTAEHYFFPPARAYLLNRCLFLLKSDAAFRERYVGDREAAMEELGLDAESRGALRTFERDRLVALGAHPYLVFMAGLRITMQGAPTIFEYF